jgi:hypothetical protein
MEWPLPLAFAQKIRSAVLAARETAHLGATYTLHVASERVTYGNVSRSAATIARKRLTLTKARFG